MKYLILWGCIALIVWLIRRDNATRPGVSPASWIPTLWVGILASRPLSAWLGWGGVDTLEGSPADRAFFFLMILGAVGVLSRRRLPWAQLFARNWPILLFYGFLLISVTWANSPLSSLKRWTKEFGNIFVALVILTEANPLQAMRAVFVRCAYVLVPLSIVFIRYFPNFGRCYNTHTGELQVTGVTMQKNSLGAMILVCTLIFIWDWLEWSRRGAARRPWLERWMAAAVFAASAWLLWQSDSKTSMTCLALAGTILAAVRVPVFYRRISIMGMYALLAGAGFFLIDRVFGITATIISSLGRDLTFTGRTDVWHELLALNTDPIFGTGFMSLWDDISLLDRLPAWIASSAHNGYLEVYLAGGYIGVALLAVLVLVTGVRINRALATGEVYAVVRFAIFVAMLLANFAESNFACMTPLGFLFLLAAIGDARPVIQWTCDTQVEANEAPQHL